MRGAALLAPYPPAPCPTAPDWAALGVPGWLSGEGEPAASGEAPAVLADELDLWLAAVLPVPSPQREGSATGAPQAARAWSCVVAEHGSGCVRWVPNPHAVVRGSAPPRHRAPCPRPELCAHRSCLEPPSLEDEGVWQFRGGAAGQKALRSALLAHKLWNDSAERAAAAAAAPTEGLAVILRAKRGADLGKSHILALCRMWCLKSDVWVRRAVSAASGEPPRRKRRLNTPVGAPEANALAMLPLCPPPAVVHADSVSALLGASASAFATVTDRAREMASQHRQLYFSQGCMAEYATLRRVCASLATACDAAADAQPAWTAAAAAAAVRAMCGGDVAMGLDIDALPAEEVLPFAPAEMPALAALLRVRDALHAGVRLWHANKMRTEQSCCGPLNPVSAVIYGRYHEALTTGQRGVALAAAWLSAAPARGAAFGELAAAAAAAARRAAAFARDAEAAFARHAEWCDQALADGHAAQLVLPFHDGAQVSTFFAEFDGDRSSDAAMMLGMGHARLELAA